MHGTHRPLRLRLDVKFRPRRRNPTGQADLSNVALQPPPPPAASRPAKPKPVAAGPRVHPPEYLARQEHNNAIRRDMQVRRTQACRACSVVGARGGSDLHMHVDSCTIWQGRQ